MDSTDWGFSSSSESDSDEDRPVSKIRTDSVFYQQYLRDDYSDDWPIELRGGHHTNNHRFANVQANSSILLDFNEQPNTSFANLSRIADMDNSRVGSPDDIMPVEDFVLINEGGRFRPVRVISKTELLPARKSKTPESKPKKLKTEPNDEEYHVPREIPLKLIDLIDPPKDPRKPKPDYDQFYDDADDNDSGLVLPRFWRETILKSAMNKNGDRNTTQNGKFRPSSSLIMKKTLERAQRLGMVAPRRDPRLDRSLFANPPRKVKSPSKPHNRSHPNIASSGSIFDADDISSDQSNFSSSSSESFGKLPSTADDHFADQNAIKVNENGADDLDSLSDDNDCSFSAFQKRKLSAKSKRPGKRTKNLKSISINDEEKVPPIRIDLRKKQVTPSTEKKRQLLFKLPKKKIDKESILTALDAETGNDILLSGSEDQENLCMNSSKLKTGITKTRKIATKIKCAPVVGYNLNVSNLAYDNTLDIADAPNSKANIDKIVTETAEQIEKVEELDVPNVNTHEIETKSPEQSDPPSQSLEKTSSSSGSIEQQLAEMTSPIKRAAEVQVKQSEVKLTDILTDGIGDIANVTQNLDKILYEVTTDSMTVVAEDSGIQTASDSPAFETHSDSNEAIQSDDQAIFTFAPPLQPSPPPQQTNHEVDIEPKTTDASVSDVVPQTIIAKEPEVAGQPSQLNGNETNEMDIISANLSFGIQGIGANAEINIAEYAANLMDTSSLNIDVGPFIDSSSPTKDGAKQSKKALRTKIIITDFSENGNLAAALKLTSNDAEISDDDYEDDQPCGMDELTLPNSNTDRNANDPLKSACNLCLYQATKGWKQLTKHYVRKHPGKEISISRLANVFNPQELQSTSLTPIITKGIAGIMIHSLCYICNQAYNLFSSKWLMHFIAHTGEFEFRCNICQKEMMQDLHKECNSKENERINGPYDFIDNVLYGYVCGLCSYVQLSKKNVVTHLENEHQQLVDGNDNIIEIILLKSTQNACNDFLNDDKNDAALLQAKERVSSIQQPNRYQNYEPVIISDEENVSGDEMGGITQPIDLTLSDEEI